MRSKGAKGAPSDEAIKRSQMKSGGTNWQPGKEKKVKNPESKVD